MIECLCVDAKNKPEEIPFGCWISEKMKYHITHIYYHPFQGLQGAILKEVKLNGCGPYKSFKLSRFAFTENGKESLKIMIKACSELEELDLQELLKELEVVNE